MKMNHVNNPFCLEFRVWKNSLPGLQCRLPAEFGMYRAVRTSSHIGCFIQRGGSNRPTVVQAIKRNLREPITFDGQMDETLFFLQLQKL